MNWLFWKLMETLPWAHICGGGALFTAVLLIFSGAWFRQAMKPIGFACFGLTMGLWFSWPKKAEMLIPVVSGGSQSAGGVMEGTGKLADGAGQGVGKLLSGAGEGVGSMAAGTGKAISDVIESISKAPGRMMSSTPELETEEQHQAAIADAKDKVARVEDTLQKARLSLPDARGLAQHQYLNGLVDKLQTLLAECKRKELAATNALQAWKDEKAGALEIIKAEENSELGKKRKERDKLASLIPRYEVAMNEDEKAQKGFEYWEDEGKVAFRKYCDSKKRWEKGKRELARIEHEIRELEINASWQEER